MVNLLKKHFSLLILVSAAFALFSISVLLKKHLTPKEYGELSLLLTYISLIFQIGLLGVEQIVLRYSELKNQSFYINKRVFWLLLIVAIVSILLSALSMLAYFNIRYLGYLIVIIVSSIISMLLYNIYRLTADFSIAQITSNGWKIILLIIIVVNIVDINIEFIIKATAVSMIIIAGYALIRFKKKYHIVFYENNNEGIYLIWLNFFLALFIGTVIGFSDRYFIEYHLGIEKLGEYFYYLTVILFPYAIFQTYFGFKELPQFRKFFSIALFHTKLVKVGLYSILLTVTLLVVYTIVNNIEFLEKYHITNYYLILILMMTGVVKMIYSILSAAMGATAEKKIFLQNNIIMLFFLTVFLATFFILKIITIEEIALIYLLTWIIRSIVYYISVIKINGMADA